MRGEPAVSPVALQAVEAALRHVRVLAAALLFLQYAARRPMLAFGLAVGMAGVNLVSLAARRNPRLAAAFGAVELAADAALVFLVVSVLEVVREDLVWVALVIPVLEAALRYRMRGAVLVWTALSAAYLAVELFLLGGPWTPAAEGAFLAELQTAVHRLAVVLLVAMPGGYLSEQLLMDIEVQRRASRDAKRRSGLLQKVAEAGERVNKLDERALDAVLECASALGFDAADVCERQADGTWQVTARWRGAGLPQPHALAAATGLALEHGATVVAEQEQATSEERAALQASGLEAVVMSPLIRRDGPAMLLRAGLRTGPLLAPQIECLELLAGQAGTALRNGILVGELRAVQGQLEYQAFHDALTGLPNRARFLLRLDEALHGTRSLETAVLFLDLDRFKPINDSFGHDVGNDVLKAVAGRLLACVREGDLVARLGGDEFAVLMHPAVSEAELVAERIVAALSSPFTAAGYEVVVGISVGIATVDESGPSATELLRRADVAMYHAKERGRGGWQHYVPALDEAGRGRAWLEADLRHALERGEMSIAYQPVIKVRTAQVAGFEALLRWHHPSEGTQSPETFISLAEDSGLIIDLGRWVLQEACAQLRRLQEHAVARPFVAVNVSPRQLQHLGFFAELDEMLTSSGVDPSGLLLEITERIVAVDGCEQLLTRLRDRGVRLALDDFGHGQTSLRYLRRFPLDVLKVDKSIVHGAAGDPRDLVILRSILALASDLGLSVVAEGVETVEHLTLLRELDCELAQGFYLHAPLEADPVAELPRLQSVKAG